MKPTYFQLWGMIIEALQHLMERSHLCKIPNREYVKFTFVNALRGVFFMYICLIFKLKSVMLGFVSFKYHADDSMSFGRLYSYDDENAFREYVRIMQKTDLVIEKTIPRLENVIFS